MFAKWTSLHVRVYILIFRSRPSASVVLPSYLKRKNVDERSGFTPKRTKTVQCWDRDIICLPSMSTNNSVHITYPRGRYCAKLGESGLIGKIRLMSTMTVEDVEDEIRSVFHRPMGDRKDFPFVFLQPTGFGSKSLTVPSLSPSFRWTPQQVARLGGSKQSIFILAQDKLIGVYEVSALTL